jgi:hypothetical protein
LYTNWRFECARFVDPPLCYDGNSQQIVWLREIFTDWSQTERRKFLGFVTGTPRLPPNGFAGLEPRRFTILYNPVSLNELPVVHNCFNRIDLPPYESKETMKEKIEYAMNETGGFEIN